MRICFWLQIDRNGMGEFHSEAGKSGRSVFVCVNHTSFLDTPLGCVLSPWHLISDLKVLMTRSMLRLPVIGRLALSVGHLPLPFLGRSNRDFRMDESLLAQALERIDSHIEADGHLIIFPEGYINDDWHTLQQFRGGGFEIAIRHDMEIWGLVIAGSADSWPATSVLGGRPAKINCRAIRIADSAKSLAANIPHDSTDSKEGQILQSQGRWLAAEARSQMQCVLDEILKPAPSGMATDRTHPANSGSVFGSPTSAAMRSRKS